MQPVDNTAINIVFFALLILCYVVFILISYMEQRRHKKEYKQYMAAHKYCTWTFEQFREYTYNRHIF